ncbi:MAG: hypothetical protein WCC36_15085 [Gammaproteobacteria bacterium]
MIFRSDIVAVIAQRVWQAGGGLVTLALVAHYLNPVQQGWYYSFLSIAALHTLFDLGLSIVLVQVSAHLFVGMKWLGEGRAEGENLPRFGALVGRSFYLYVRLAVLFVVVVLPAGLWFFSAKGGGQGTQAVGWRAEWIVLVLLTAFNVLLMPFQSSLEGSGRIREIYGLRLIQGLVGSVACWATLILGGGLWAAVMVPAFSMLIGVAWLFGRQWELIKSALRHRTADFDWRGEVWTLQWRLGLSWLAGYLVSQVYTPMLFQAKGPVVAGQMGLSLAIANMLSLVSQSWITRRVPQMAQAVENRDWQSLDSLFFRDFTISVAVFVVGAFGVCLMYWLLSGTHYHGRVLPFLPFAGLLATTLLRHIVGALAAQLRSFRREPLVWVTVVAAFVTVAGAMAAAGPFGAEGVVVVILSAQLLLVLPISVGIWRKCNRSWRVTQ